MRVVSLLALSAVLAVAQAAPAPTANRDAARLGHSRHGAAFDSGPRGKPWRMEGIGRTHFPITTKVPEVQEWFDQGHTLLHSFWYYEAERAFRWCLKLEPDNAMAYWGLARAAESEDRAREFLREASKRKQAVTERERLYIEAWEKRLFRDPLRDKNNEREDGQDREFRRTLETLIVKYPDDVEAKALLAISTLGEGRIGQEAVLQQVLAKEPDHPGAHHYRIHLWNYHETEQALGSAKRYGELAQGIGHALHMPGHIYSTVGMWHEAAIAMDAATRAERRYMRQRLTFPFNNWNYGHNRNYLCYIQEQLGMADAAVFGARQLIEAPKDPQFNADALYSSHSQGINALLRALVKFEKWDELLDEKAFPWRDVPMDHLQKAYAAARGHLGRGDVANAQDAVARHASIEEKLKEQPFLKDIHVIQAQELKARLALLRGDTLTGLGLLADAARREYEHQLTDNDPPFYPESLYNMLGRAYLDARSPALAVAAFTKALVLTRNDWWALAGLVEAHHALGEPDKARDAMARLRFVTSDADANLPALRRALATGVEAEPRDMSPAPQRNYRLTSLEKHGPDRWVPYEAPALSALDAKGRKVDLSQYRGKNLLLVFYLGQECPHCLKQLRDIEARKDDWERQDVVVLAVSPDTPEQNAASLKKQGSLGTVLLSDSRFLNAKAFQAYDDFEEKELHATILIDKEGRVHWARVGGEPFGDMDFLVKQVERMNLGITALKRP